MKNMFCLKLKEQVLSQVKRTECVSGEKNKLCHKKTKNKNLPQAVQRIKVTVKDGKKMLENLSSKNFMSRWRNNE